MTYAARPDIRRDPYSGHVFKGGGRPIDPSASAPTLLASMGGSKTPWIDTANIVPGYHAHLVAGGQPRSGLVPGARRITVEEAALLQTFPPAMRFEGARSSRYRQVGNAAPPRLAEVLARALVAQLDGSGFGQAKAADLGDEAVDKGHVRLEAVQMTMQGPDGASPAAPRTARQ